MKNNKGFTLIELIAMLTVLAILMVVTVPNITGIINQQRENAFIEDAEKLMSTAQTKLLSDRNVKKPAENNCIVMTMNFLDKGREMLKSADGGEYLRRESFIMIKRVDKKIEYTVRLVEVNLNEEVYGIDKVDQATLEKEGTKVLGYAEEEGFNIDGISITDLKAKDPFVNKCNEIEAIYK